MERKTAGGETTARQSQVRREHRQFGITGLSCAAEAAGLERRLRRVAGVQDATVNPLTELAYVDFDPARVDPATLVAAIESAGYHAR